MTFCNSIIHRLSKNSLTDSHLTNSYGAKIYLVNHSTRFSYTADNGFKYQTPCLINKNKFKSSCFTESTGINFTKVAPGGIFCRYSHTDIKFPGFTDVRVEKSDKHADTQAEKNTKFMYGTFIVSASAAAVGIKSTARMCLDSMGPDHKELVGNSLEYDLKQLSPGETVKLKFGMKPVYVSYLLDDQLESLKSVPMSELRDPETIEKRCPHDPRYMVAIGVCTHLGCIPSSNEGAFHGFFCPCHGSHYDKAGRIRIGPAPSNLEIPTYRIDENKILYIN